MNTKLIFNLIKLLKEFMLSKVLKKKLDIKVRTGKELLTLSYTNKFMIV